MKPLLNQLIQYQELLFAQRENEALTSKAHLRELENALAKMHRQLPPEIASLVDDLQARSPLIVATVHSGSCSACRSVLPTSVQHDIKTAGEMHTCGACGRILFPDESGLKQTGKRRGKFGQPVAGIAQYSSMALVIPRLKGDTRDEVIAEMAGIMAQEGYVEDPEALTDLALRREAVVSTAVEKGLAFPHVRGLEGGGLTLAVGIKKKGIDFGAPKGTRTRIVFFSVIPTAASAFYLKLLSVLIKSFREADARKELIECSTQEEAWAKLSDLTKGGLS